jgi:hypothetical protein
MLCELVVVTFISLSACISGPPKPGLFHIDQEKETRSTAQQKIDSQLLYAIYQMRGEATAKGTPTEPIQLRRDSSGRVLVDLRAPVTRKLLSRVRAFKGKIISTSERDDSIVAYLPLSKLESLAQLSEVKFITPAAEATTHQQ